MKKYSLFIISLISFILVISTIILSSQKIINETDANNIELIFVSIILIPVGLKNIKIKKDNGLFILIVGILIIIQSAIKLFT